jgi:MFS family permease
MLGADYAFFLVALAFASPSTILPAFAASLGAPNVVIGAIPAVMTAGWFVPPLFVAAYTEGLARKLPFMLRWTLWERVPFIVLAAAAYWLTDRAPALTLGLLLAMLLVVTGIGGALMPAWMDLIGRVIPLGMRGRFFAVASVAASVAGLGASALAADVLATYPPSTAYALCFLCGAACLAVSFVALALVREPAAAATTPHAGLGAYLRRMPALLRRDSNLAWYLVARSLSSAATMASAFYTVHALRAWRTPPATVGIFTALLLAGTIVGTIVLGWLADRVGHRLVIMAGIGSGVAANVVALAATSLDTFGVVFALTGLQQAAVTVSNLNVMLEFAPAPEEQPTYLGIGSTSLAPVAFAAPLAGGVLADAAGFPVVFAASALFGTAAVALLALRVRDPRHARALAVEGSA